MIGIAAGAALVIVVMVALVAFAVYCLIDMIRADRVRSLSKGVWAVIICLSIPWGGLAYLIFARPRAARPPLPGQRP